MSDFTRMLLIGSAMSLSGMAFGLYGNSWDPRDLNEKLRECEKNILHSEECELIAVKKGETR